MSKKNSLSLLGGGIIFLALTALFVLPVSVFGKVDTWGSANRQIWLTATPGGTIPSTLPTATPGGTLPTTPYPVPPTATPAAPTPVPPTPTVVPYPGGPTATPVVGPTATPVPSTGGGGFGSGPNPVIIVIPIFPGGRHVVHGRTINVFTRGGFPQFHIGYGVVAQTYDANSSDRGMLEGVVAVFLPRWLSGGYHFQHRFNMAQVSPHANRLWRRGGVGRRAAFGLAANNSANSFGAQSLNSWSETDVPAVTNADADVLEAATTQQDVLGDVQLMCLNDRGEWHSDNVDLRGLDIQPIIDPDTGETIDFDVQVEATIRQHGTCGLFVRNNEAEDENVQARAEDELDSVKDQLEDAGAGFIEPETEEEAATE